jgi:hypothetical protein
MRGRRRRRRRRLAAAAAAASRLRTRAVGRGPPGPARPGLHRPAHRRAGPTLAGLAGPAVGFRAVSRRPAPSAIINPAARLVRLRRIQRAGAPSARGVCSRAHPCYRPPLSRALRSGGGPPASRWPRFPSLAVGLLLQACHGTWTSGLVPGHEDSDSAAPSPGLAGRHGLSA